MDDFKMPQLPTAASGEKNNGPELKSNEPKDVESEQLKPKPTSAIANALTSIAICPYKVPPWSQPPPKSINYKFEILKSGQIIDEIKNLETKAFWKFGRLPPPANDLELAHPTVSRFHAILQYRPKTQSTQSDDESDTDKQIDGPPEGWYIYDMNSTHGTFLNKQRLPQKVFIRIRVGHMLRLGASTRSYILQGPEEDVEPESDLTVTELRAQCKQKMIEAKAKAIQQATEAEERERNNGISWGMAEDADEETDLTHNPFASTINEELFLHDPKKTLRGYFEREGLQLEYKCDEMSAGSFVCRIELPLSDACGRPIVAETVHKGRKKECAMQCAFEACRILDRHGVLRQSNQEPLKRKVKSKSDSDEDDFLDRTGDVERKKQRKSNPSTNSALTYEDLLKKDADIVAQLQLVENDISRYQETQRRLKASQTNNTEDLDHFMENLTDENQLDRTEIRKLRLEQQRLNVEKQKVQRLIKITKPINFAFAKPTEEAKADASTKRQLPMIGKRNQFSKFKIARIVTSKIEEKEKQNNIASDEEEMEEDDETKTSPEEVLKMSVANESPVAKEAGECKHETSNKELLQTSTNSPESKIYGPAIVPHEILDNNEQESLAVPSKPEQDAKLPAEPDNADVDTETENSRKKRRQRQRQRQKRQEIDLEELEEHETSDKYAKWVPPSNQSGDGYTELNAKYGY